MEWPRKPRVSEVIKKVVTGKLPEDVHEYLFYEQRRLEDQVETFFRDHPREEFHYSQLINELEVSATGLFKTLHAWSRPIEGGNFLSRREDNEALRVLYSFHPKEGGDPDITPIESPNAQSGRPLDFMIDI